MGKIALIVPTEQMREQAVTVAERINMAPDIYQETSQTVLARVAQAQSEGALVVIARGNHANLILKTMDIPLVEIRLSGQVLAQMIAQAKALCDQPCPRLAFVGFPNMFTDTQAFEAMFGVSIHYYFVEDGDQFESAVVCAHQDGTDVLIGGEIALEYAAKLGMTALFLQSGTEDIEAALRSAKRMLYAIEIEKKNTAEIATLLNYSFDGVLRLNSEGCVTVANYMAERIFQKRMEELIGRHVSTLFDAQDSQAISQIITEGRTQYAMVLHKGNISLIANIAAISVDRENAGAILSFQEFRTIEQLEEGIRRDRSSKGLAAQARFEQCAFVSPNMKQIQHTATQYAKFDLPVLMAGELGTGKRMLAECIHNASMRRKNPFVVFDCASIPPDMQYAHLMGKSEKGALQLAHTGTLLVDHIELLETNCQYQLLRGLRDGLVWPLEQTSALSVNLRVIATTSCDLYPLVREGKFSEPLYCLLSQLELFLPPLRERREDIPTLVRAYTDKYCAQYRKYIVLTEDAEQYLCALPWPGNALQLRLFVEKLVLLTESRVVDVETVQALQPRSFSTPRPAAATPQEPTVVYGDREAARLLRLLDEHGGNRKQVAEVMGVSKSTLWRKMKKMGIEQSFKL